MRRKIIPSLQKIMELLMEFYQ